VAKIINNESWYRQWINRRHIHDEAGLGSKRTGKTGLADRVSN